MAWKFFTKDGAEKSSAYGNSSDRGTSFPTSPYDGQEFSLIVDSTNGVEWRFKYNAGSASAYKWEFLGGPPLAAGQAGSISTSSTTYVDMTSGPTLTVPRAGDYIVQVDLFGQCSSFTAAYELRSQAVFSTSGAGSEQVLFVAVAVFNGARAAFTEKRTGLVAAETVKLQVRGGATHTSTFNSAFMRLIPVRVS